MLDTNTDDLEVLDNIRRLKDVATALSASHSGEYCLDCKLFKFVHFVKHGNSGQP